MRCAPARRARKNRWPTRPISEVASGIRVDRHGERDAPFVILLDGFDRRVLASEQRVECIGARFRPQAHAVAGFERLARESLRAVQSQPCVVAERFGAREHGAHACITARQLALLVVGKREHAQRRGSRRSRSPSKRSPGDSPVRCADGRSKMIGDDNITLASPTSTGQRCSLVATRRSKIGRRGLRRRLEHRHRHHLTSSTPRIVCVESISSRALDVRHAHVNLVSERRPRSDAFALNDDFGVLAHLHARLAERDALDVDCALAIVLVEKAHTHGETRALVTAHDAFGLHDLARRERAERKPLLIFHRRRPVRIEHESFVKERAHERLDAIEIHGVLPSSASIVSSHESDFVFVLYATSLSKTSR